MFQWPPKGAQVLVYTNTHYFCIFKIPPPPRLFIESNKQNKQTTLSKSNKTRLTQNNKCTQEMQDERMNHLEESFTFQTGDLEGEDASFSFSFSFFLFFFFFFF